MFTVEVRRSHDKYLLQRLGTSSNTLTALQAAAQTLKSAGACMFSAHNRREGSGLRFIEVTAEAFPFYVVILNTQLVDADGEPLPVGAGIGPFSVPPAVP